MHRFIALCALLVITGLVAVFAADSPSTSQVIQFDHEKVDAIFAKGGRILVTDTFKVQTGHRTGPGEVEIHDHDTDVFYIVKGSATFVTGGKPVDTRVTDPGETRGKEIVGGEARHLVKGDVIVIPSGIPHWFKEVDGTFEYFVVKVTK